MKKEFLDYLYELRGLVIMDIDKLVTITRQPTDDDYGHRETEAELRTRRSQIEGINKTIEKYLEIHK